MYTNDRQKELITQSKELLSVNINALQDETSIAKLAEQLRKVLRFHDRQYYVLSEPVVSDYEYDQLFSLLKAVENKRPDLITTDSPTHRVAYGLTKDFPEVAHLTPMLSLDNSYNLDDLKDFDRRVKELTGSEKIEYAVEPKFDGAGISLVYENDLLARGATRGNGIVGEEITNNLKVLRSIPLSASFSKYGIYKIEVRGEMLIRKDIFKKTNQKRLDEGSAPFANPRNSASGSLRMQDSQEVAKRGLEGFIYQISYAGDIKGNNIMHTLFQQHQKNTELLYQLGFKVPYKETKVFEGITEVLNYCKLWEAKRDDYPYEIDGMVVKVNDLHLYEKLGATAHHPRWAIAFKFKANKATTKLLDVIFNVGRTGAVTPIAKLEPVSVGGVTVSSVTMFNKDFITEKDIRMGDNVLVERAGDVIPYIVKPVKEARDGKETPIIFPKRCPSCDAALVKPEEEAIWRCININCSAQVAERIIHYVSKNAMDIEGLGESIVKKLFELKILLSIPEIYKLDYKTIEELEGFGERSAENLQQSIEASKNKSISRLLFGLGIRFVGETTAKVLINEIQCIRDLKNCSIEKLEAIKDVGPKVAQSIYDFFHHEKNLLMIEELEKSGIQTCKGKESTPKTGKLSGMTFLFTGTLQNFSRNQAKEMVESLGGNVLNSVSSKLNYLVAGESPGSKLQKAQAIDTIEIISEKKFLSLLS